jgi:hypothetical protein
MLDKCTGVSNAYRGACINTGARHSLVHATQSMSAKQRGVNLRLNRLG